MFPNLRRWRSWFDFRRRRESASGSSETICCLWGGNKIRKLNYLMEEAVRAGADTIITASTNQCCHNSMTVLLAAREGMACRVIMESWGDTRYRYETASNHTMIEFCGPEEVSVETSLPSGPVEAMPEAMDGVRFDSPVKAVDEITTLSNLISADTRRSRFRKSRGAYFLKISHFDTCVLT